jgi:hypothetical protein
MRLEVVVQGKVVQEDDLDYHKVPSSDVIMQLENEYNIPKLRNAGIEAGIGLVLASKMNNPIWQRQNATELL